MRLFALFLFCFALNAFSESMSIAQFANNKDEVRYTQLISEIRCPVCQGQSIGGSNSALAKDLRGVVEKMIKAKATNNAIFSFMTERYGDFVIFNPPINSHTYILWFAPFLFIIIAIFIIFRSKKSTPEVDKKKLNAANNLLKK